MRAEQMVEEFPVVDIDAPARAAVRMLADLRLNGLLVCTGNITAPYAVLPASQVVRFLVPSYVLDDPGLARVVTETMADRAIDNLTGKTIRDLLPENARKIPVVTGDNTIIEVAAVMSRMHSPLVTVVEDGRLRGVITATRLLAETLKS